MTKRYTILQKKLSDLESKLNQALSLPPNNPCNQTLSQDIQQRFLFFNNLLSAELSSRPTKPFHLQHIANRVLELEAAFKDWESFQSSGLEHVEKGSTCSCTESCLNDDGEAEAEEAEEGSSELISLSDLEQAAEASTELRLVGGLDLQSFKEQDKAELEHVEKHEMSESEREEEEEEEDRVDAAKKSLVREAEAAEITGVGFCSCLAPLASGVLLGMILMVRFFCCFPCYDFADYTDSLSPT